MILQNILSSRRYDTGVAHDLIYEWEDVIARELDIPIKDRMHFFDNRFAFKASGLLGPLQTFSNSFVISMTDISCLNNKHIIPQIVDFYFDKNHMPQFAGYYKRNPIVLISSFEAYTVLKNSHTSLNIAHFPLSLPDKYRITDLSKFSKVFDVVCVGHQNPVLLGFLKKYAFTHTDFVYVYRKPQGRFSYMTSKGDDIGSIVTRDDYFNLIRKSKVALYSTPGIDGDEKRTNGYSQVTPRFLELLSAGCHIIARYKNNPDTDYYQLSKFSPSVDCYEQFEALMDKARESEVDMKEYSDYLENHYTSVRAKQLTQILSEL